ncbi:MAG: polysaccharide deacetylase family protein [Anaerolineae bacterium]
MLGFPPDARLLIVNADDFGMCHAINDATIRTIRHGLATSCTVMMPCPWSLHALHLLTDNSDIPFGVHLTAISEMPLVRWGPLTPKAEVPSLIDEAGYFYSEERIPEFLSQVRLDDLEKEFRAQIEAVVAAGLQPTHLDSHCLIHTSREDIFDMTVDLACEYGLALRVGVREFIEKLQQTGYPTDDHQILDSYRFDTRDKPELYPRLLRELPAGLSEWAIHPGIGNAELRALSPDWDVRQADFDFFTSPVARDIINKEGIVLLSYEPLQALWRTIQA